MTRWVALVAVAIIVAAGFAFDRSWVWFTLAVVTGAFASLVLHPRMAGSPARQRAAAARWTPERAAGVVAGVDDEVAAVRALRRADPDLSLLDARNLVRAGRRG